jgi:hypothetical protein
MYISKYFWTGKGIMQNAVVLRCEKTVCYAKKERSVYFNIHSLQKWYNVRYIMLFWSR